MRGFTWVALAVKHFVKINKITLGNTKILPAALVIITLKCSKMKFQNLTSTYRTDKNHRKSYNADYIC